MRVINADGNPIVLNSQEVCIIWFLMTGMRPKEIGDFMKKMSKTSVTINVRL